MAANRTRRLQKEVQDILKDTQSGITITSPTGSTDITDFTRFHGHFRGPPDTPYESGAYEIDIRITSEYPFKPPEMRFITRIWHPNVSSQTGAICLDTLGTAWSPILTLKSALISLQSLLSSPEPKDPQDAEVASMLITRPDEFRHVAREWAQRYAGAPTAERGSGKTGASGSGDPLGTGARDGGGGGARTGGAGGRGEDKDGKRREDARRREAYRGYNPSMVDRFVGMGFQIEQVVEAFEYVELEKEDGEEYALDEEYVEDITNRLFGEV